MKKKMHKQNPRIKQIVKDAKPDDEQKKVKMVFSEKNHVVKENRHGLFDVAAGLFDDMPWPMCQQLMKHFLIIEAGMIKGQPIFRFHAFSPLFDKVSALEKDVPTYMIKVKGDKGKITVKAEKVKKSKILTPDGKNMVLNNGS